RWVALLATIAGNADVRVGDLDLLLPEQRSRLVPATDPRAAAATTTLPVLLARTAAALFNYSM
ncbi:hypothetical protein J8J20_25160, partial [Mycobacterium tuberculosis]|nr:hypothetical protein [Mycobacterium tuberculosis]